MALGDPVQTAFALGTGNAVYDQVNRILVAGGSQQWLGSHIKSAC